MTLFIENQEITLEPEISQRVETLAALYQETEEQMVNRLVQKGLTSLDHADGVPE